MYSALLVANKFVDLSIKEKSLFTHMKLQKLIYIANGINLASYGYPLIIERIEVWPYGPVVASVYHNYKVFGNSDIPFNMSDYNNNEHLDEKAQISFDDAWKVAKSVNCIKLSNWTHITGSPWSKAKDENLEIIPDTYMETYFKRFLNK